MVSTAALILAAALASPDAGEEKQRPFSEEIVIEATRSPDGYLLGWHEYTSEHFVVDSDLATWAVTDLVRKLETLRAIELRSLIDEPVALPGRVRVIASGASLLFSELAKDQYFTGSGPKCQTYVVSCKQVFDDEAFFQKVTCGAELHAAASYFVSRLGEATIVLPSGPAGPSGEVTAHELAHHLAAVLFLRPGSRRDLRCSCKRSAVSRSTIRLQLEPTFATVSGSSKAQRAWCLPE